MQTLNIISVIFGRIELSTHGLQLIFKLLDVIVFSGKFIVMCLNHP